jgi:DNA-binding ferritin-like protein (Dps family)
MVPSQEQIEKFIPSQKEWKTFQKHLKWIPFFGEEYPQQQRTTMVFRVSFKNIHILKNKPEMFEEAVQIEVY